jgi:hypothetical protein
MFRWKIKRKSFRDHQRHDRFCLRLKWNISITIIISLALHFSIIIIWKNLEILGKDEWGKYNKLMFNFNSLSSRKWSFYYKKNDDSALRFIKCLTNKWIRCQYSIQGLTKKLDVSLKVIDANWKAY